MDIQSFVDNIHTIIDKVDGSSLETKQIQVVCTTLPYSSKKQPIWRLILNGKPLSKHSPYRVGYRCLTCERDSKVGMTQVMRKLNGDFQHCAQCCNLDLSKRQQHSPMMTASNGLRNTKPHTSNTPSQTSCLDLIKRSHDEFFQSLTKAEVDAYFKTHLTVEDFDRLRPHVVGIRNGHVSGAEFDRLQYVPITKVANQMRFSSTMYDAVSDVFIKPDQPIFRCEECETEWRGKSLELYKNAIKVLCQGCKLCRKTFRRRSLTVNDFKVIYQSKLELKFLLWCKEHGLCVRNGPVLDYVFQDKSHKYYVDFVLPDLNMLVEVKDNHIWHKQQIQSGKWKAKMESVKQNLVKNGGVYDSYYMIYPKNWMEITKQVLSRCKI